MARRDNRDGRGYSGDGGGRGEYGGWDRDYDDRDYGDRGYSGGGYGYDYGATGRGLAGPGEGYYGWRGWYGPGESYYGEPYGGYGYGYGTRYHGEGRTNQGQYTGRGPRNYTRSDDRIIDDINDRLTDHGGIDAEDIIVQVSNGDVTLSGTVNGRWAKRMAEDVAWGVSGVKEVHNQLKTRQSGNNQGNQNQTTQTNNRQPARTT